MGVVGGVAEHFVHAGEEAVGDDVLEDFGLVMDFGPVEFHDFDEEAFDEAVAAEDEEGGFPSGGVEVDAFAGGVFDELLFEEVVHHGGGGSGGNRQALSNLSDGDEGSGVVLLEAPDGLEVVLDGA